jgi:hypothetical protein
VAYWGDSAFLTSWKAFTEEVGPVLAQEMSAQSPVNTGQLANSQSWRDNQGTLEVISTDNRGPIAAYVIRGTRPHSIDPVNARMLHWVGPSGENVFAHHVDHPGTLPNKYNVAAWEAQRLYVLRAFGRIVGRGYALSYLNPWRNRVI